ncbi:hypothetical protein QTP86_012182 [Hemibagrus guttatus]|nr:hypothetical protein QTP86_012182 [Hemibagrus guttatus]
MHFGLEVTDITISPDAYILREALTRARSSQQRRDPAQESAPSPRQYESAEFAGLGDPDQRDMDERSTSEDDRICFLLKEKDSESHISCKHRLTRSKFNYNPFGLRFGKRDGRFKTDRTGTRKILPLLLFVRELEEAS